MRICILGKFPPIQGGVSMRSYWTAHRLAEQGHDVHVVTNAKEAQLPYRMHMRPADWVRCAADYDGGRVTVHWTDPIDASQSYLPMASPFVSKLAGIAIGLHAERPFDVIFSHYLEPYGVAGYLVAQATRLPHVVRMAGSDSGRLWRHQQLGPLYNQVLHAAAAVVATGAVADRAIACGVDPAKIVSGGGFSLPETLFAPIGPKVDWAALRAEIAQDPAMAGLLWGGFKADSPYFGIYGKLGQRKGSFALLAAMERLKRAGLDVGLVALAHGPPEIENQFRAQVEERGLFDRVLQIPFLPHWRVPEFLRGCLAVCCLEQDFPIAHHTPIIPLEVLFCGKCLVGSTEVIRKLPDYRRLPHGYGCVAIEDVNDIAVLSERLAAIVQDPAPAIAVGARGYAFARALQDETAFPQILERILAAAASGETMPAAVSDAPDAEAGERDGAQHFLPAQRAIAAAESAAASMEPVAGPDPLFTLRTKRWALEEGELAELIPVRDPTLRVLAFGQDISSLPIADRPPMTESHPSHMVVFAGVTGSRDPLLVDHMTARILELSDGGRTVREIIKQLKKEDRSCTAEDEVAWFETLFIGGLIYLHHPEVMP